VELGGEDTLGGQDHTDEGNEDGNEIQDVAEQGKDPLVKIADVGIEAGEHTDGAQDYTQEGGGGRQSETEAGEAVA
jgi:hypothetical protein